MVWPTLEVISSEIIDPVVISVFWFIVKVEEIVFVVSSIDILVPAYNLSCFASISDWVKPLPLASSTKFTIVFPPTSKSPHVSNPLASNVPKVKLDVNNISACFPFNEDVKY